MTTAATPGRRAGPGGLPTVLAGAAASAPEIAGVGILATAFLFENVVWAAGAGLLAGALLRRAGPRVLGVVVCGLALWLAVALADGRAWQWPVSDLDWNPVRDIGNDGWMPVLLSGATLVACVVGSRHGAFAAVTTAAVCLMLPGVVGYAGTIGRSELFANRMSEFGLGIGALAIALAAARRWTLGALTAVLVAGAQYAIVRYAAVLPGGSIRTGALFVRFNAVFVGSGPGELPTLVRIFPGTGRTDTVAAVLVAVAVLACVVFAGAMAGAVARGTQADEGTRFIVRCQRRPWLTSLVAASLISALAGLEAWSSRSGRDRLDEADALTLLPLVPVTFACIAQLGRGGRNTIDRVAPWLAANVAALALALAASGLWPWRTGPAEMLLITMPLAAWPLLAAALIPGDPPGDETPVAAVAFTATLVALPPAVAWWAGPPDAWAIGAAFALLVAPLAFHALLRSRASAARILVVAALCGVAWGLLGPQPDERRQRSLAPDLTLAPSVAIACGLLVLTARRARSMTAIPRDHPVVADFGGT